MNKRASTTNPNMSVFVVLLLTATIALLSVHPSIPLVSANTTTKKTITICTMPIASAFPTALHGAFAVHYLSTHKNYSDKYSIFNWSYKFLGGYVANEKYLGGKMIQSFVVDGHGCDAVVGPGYSYVAVALTTVIDKGWQHNPDLAWLDPSASSISLDNNFDLFNRVIPNDIKGAQSAVKALMHLRWTEINVLCLNGAFAASYAKAVVDKIIQEGGGVHVNECFPDDVTKQEISSFLDKVLLSPSKVLVVSMLATADAANHLIDLLKERQLEDTLQILWAESFCSTSEIRYKEIRGSVCTAYSPDATLMDPFLAEYRKRDLSETSNEIQQLTKLGFKAFDTDPLLNLKATNTYGALAFDATQHVMHCFVEKERNSPAESMQQIMRTQSTTGVTGHVTLGADGNRDGANMIIINVDAENNAIVVGDIIQDTAKWTQTAGVKFYLHGKTYAVPEEMLSLPTGHNLASGSTSEGLSDTIIVVIVIACVCMFAIVAFFLQRVLNKRTKDNSRAPTDENRPIAIVFTDIQASTALWARDPEAMSAAVEQHHTQIRKQITRYDGYEVKTVGDAFMVVFNDIHRAVEFSLSVQLMLKDLSWSSVFDDFYKEVMERTKVSVADELYKELWNGLRVRIGIHFGEASVHFDHVSLGYDYYGTAINMAARIETIGHGGQVLLSETAMSCLGDRKSQHDARITDLGAQRLNGIETPVRVFQMQPNSLTRRTFPALRLNAEVSDVVVFDDHETSGSDQGDGRSALDGPIAPQVPPGQEEAFRMSKHIGGSQNPVDVANRLTDFQNFQKVILSTLARKDRLLVMEVLARYWSVGVSRSALKEPNTFDSTMLKIVYKAYKTYEEASRISPKNQQRQRRGSATSQTPMTFRLHPVQMLGRSPSVCSAASVSSMSLAGHGGESDGNSKKRSDVKITTYSPDSSPMVTEIITSDAAEDSDGNPLRVRTIPSH